LVSVAYEDYPLVLNLFSAIFLGEEIVLFVDLEYAVKVSNYDIDVELFKLLTDGFESI